MAKVIQVIESYDRRGIGRESDPIRMVRQFFTFEGELLFEFDPCLPNPSNQRPDQETK